MMPFFHHSWRRPSSCTSAASVWFQVEIQPFNDPLPPVTPDPRLQYYPSGTGSCLLYCLGSCSFFFFFPPGRRCGSSPKYTRSLDCVGATSVIAYLASNYCCLSHSQPTQALIEFLSLWVMSYLSWEPSVSFADRTEKMEQPRGLVVYSRGRRKYQPVCRPWRRVTPCLY